MIDPGTGMLVGGIVAGGGALGSGILGSQGAQAANATSWRIAQENRDWMERMSNSAHQREVADLRAAGLNPILSAGGGGAGTPTPSSPIMQNTKGALGEGIAAASGKVMEALMNKAAVSKTAADTAKVLQDTKNGVQTERLIEAQTASARNQAVISGTMAKVMDAGGRAVDWIKKGLKPLGDFTTGSASGDLKQLFETMPLLYKGLVGPGTGRQVELNLPFVPPSEYRKGWKYPD